MNEYEFDMTISGEFEDLKRFSRTHLHNDEENNVWNLEFKTSYAEGIYINEELYNIEYIDYDNDQNLQIIFITDIVPDDWINEVITDFPNLVFEFRYYSGTENISGVITGNSSDIIDADRGCNGEYYGYKLCKYCDLAIDYLEDYCNILRCCGECYNTEILNAKNIIEKYVKRRIVRNLFKSLALKRMGRNQIMDNYLMRTVFIKRVFEGCSN